MYSKYSTTTETALAGQYVPVSRCIWSRTGAWRSRPNGDEDVSRLEHPKLLGHRDAVGSFGSSLDPAEGMLMRSFPANDDLIEPPVPYSHAFTTNHDGLSDLRKEGEG